MTVATPYADALAIAATAAIHAAIAGDDAALLDAVAHLAPGERLNIFRAARRLADVCGATANNRPNPTTPPLFGLLVQKYEVEYFLSGLTALRGRFPSKHHLRRVDFIRGNIIRQMQQQGVAHLDEQR